MTTNKQFQAFMTDFAEHLNQQRNFLENEHQRWGFDQAIASFLKIAGKPDYYWFWEKSGVFQGTINTWTGVSRIRHVEIDNFMKTSGIYNPPSYDLKDGRI